MKKLRALHLYLGCIFAPMLIFFAMSGIWQTLGIRSGIFVWLSTIHTEWQLKNGSHFGSWPLRIFVVVMAASFVISTSLGVVMALKHGGSRKAIYCLACGVLLPLAIIFIFRTGPHPGMLTANQDSSVIRLASAAANGEASAVNQLESLCQAASRRPATPSDRGDKLREFRTAFEILGSRAGQGNDHAVDALLQAIKLPYVQGFAVDALGEAAGLGNQKAIEALAAWANDPGFQYNVEVALQKPATLAGKATAIDALALIARGNDYTSEMALGFLKTASSNHIDHATDVLRKLEHLHKTYSFTKFLPAGRLWA